MRGIRLFGICSMLWAGSGSAWGQAALNLTHLKGDTLVFEKILDESLKLAFNDPFAITENPQATYLQGYGIVVSVHLNINRQTVRTPFGEIRMQGQGKAGSSAVSKEEQIERAREIAIQCLADYAGAIKQLGAHDQISINAHLEDRNELDPVKKRTILVVTVSRDNIDLLAMKKISEEDFQKKVSVLQY